MILQQTWHDYRLAWRPSDFGGISNINIAPDKMWKPDIVLLNKYVIRFGYLCYSVTPYVSVFAVLMGISKQFGSLTWCYTAMVMSYGYHQPFLRVLVKSMFAISHSISSHAMWNLEA